MPATSPAGVTTDTFSPASEGVPGTTLRRLPVTVTAVPALTVAGTEVPVSAGAADPRNGGSPPLLRNRPAIAWPAGDVSQSRNAVAPATLMFALAGTFAGLTT